MQRARGGESLGSCLVGLTLGAVTALRLMTACGSSGAFLCQSDLSCLNNSQQGQCQPDGYCSFPDSECISGQRYGTLAAADRAGDCVPEDMGSTSRSGQPPSEDTLPLPTSGPSPDPDGGAITGESMTSTSSSTATSGDFTDDGSDTMEPPANSCLNPDAEELVDEFDDGVIGAEWGINTFAGAAIEEREGKLLLSISDNSSSQAFLDSDFTPMIGVAVQIEVPDISSAPEGVAVSLDLVAPDDCWISIEIFEQMVRAIDDGDVFDATGVSADTLKLQLRIDSDEVAHWEWSEDGMQWNVLLSKPTSCDFFVASTEIWAFFPYNISNATTRAVESFARTCEPL